MLRRSLLGSLVALGAAVTALPAQGPDADTVRLSVADAVTRALRESDEVRLANAQVDVTEAQVTMARAGALPSLTFQGRYTQVTRNARATIVGQIFGQNYNYNTTLALSQPLFQGGRLWAAMRAAGDARSAASNNLAETRARLSVDAQRAYLNALLARELVEIQERNAELADARLAQVTQLEQAGRASRYDLLKARVERANLEPGLLQARSNKELADIELRQLLNLPGNAPIVLTQELDTAALRALARRISSDSARPAVRPMVRAAEATLDARREGIRVARAEFFPTISAFFNTGYTALPSGPGFPTKWGETSSSYCPPGSDPGRVCQNNGWYPDRSFGLQVQWPIFDGFRAKGSLDLAAANERVARSQLELARETAAADLARAEAEFARAEATFDAQRQNASEAEEAFRIASLRFERGLGTQLEVTDAQFALFTARVNAARATIDYYLATAELARARGQDVPLPPTRPASR
ncbi:MAG TPA: TolC family protein [Gemmatimonadaceae bacterium]